MLQDGTGNPNVVILGQSPHQLNWSIVNRRQPVRKFRQRLGFNFRDKANKNVVENADVIFVEVARTVDEEIRNLPQHIGTPLFRRLPRGLLLTEAGQRLLPELRDAFERLTRAVSRLEDVGHGTLSVSTLTTFALNWLVARLARFQEKLPRRSGGRDSGRRKRPYIALSRLMPPAT